MLNQLQHDTIFFQVLEANSQTVSWPKIEILEKDL